MNGLRTTAALLALMTAPFFAWATAFGGEELAPSGALSLKHCLVTAVDDVQVPAMRPGVLSEIKIKEGAHVTAEFVVAQIDDKEAQMQLRSAQAERDAADAKAKSDLEVRYAEATHRVAEKEHEISKTILEKSDKSGIPAVSFVELERLRLTAEQASMKIELSKFDRSVKVTETGVSLAKADLAKHDVDQRQVRAPLEGEIAELYVQKGEWVEAGKPVVRIVRLDKLRVEGFIHVRDALPGDIVDRPVKVTVELARGEKRDFAGKITFVSPLVQAGGDYRIWAEVDNRQEQKQWLLRPGLEAEMTFENRTVVCPCAGA